MTQRFGRNQRRRAREQALALQQTIHALTSQMVVQQEANDRAIGRVQEQQMNMAMVMAEIRRMLPHGHITQPPPRQELHDLHLEGDSVRMADTSPVVLYEDFLGNEAMDSMTMLVDDLTAFVIRPSARYDVFRRSLHFRATWGDTVVGYGLTEQAMHETPLVQLAPKIAEEMAELLVKEARAAMGNRR